MFIMFPLFNHPATASATYAEAAVQPVKPVRAPENDTTATEQPATYDELLPYLMLAMASGV
jgi:hypothetical protein